LTRDHDPIVWDFGSAVIHHQLFSPWLEPENSRAGMLGLRGAIAPQAGLFESAVKEIVGILAEHGVLGQPIGIDIVELPFLFEMQSQVWKFETPADDARRAPDKVAGRNHAALTGRGNGRRCLSGHL